MGGRGVVDGQHLQRVLCCRRCPAHHGFQVAEVANAVASAGAQRKHRHHRAGPAPQAYAELGLQQLVGHHVAGLHVGQRDRAVGAVFPHYYIVVVVACDDKLKLHERAVYLRCVEAHHPLVGRVLGHAQPRRFEPVAKVWAAAGQGQPLARAQLRGPHFQAYHLAEVGHGAQLTLAPCNALGEGRAVEQGVGGHVNPLVVHHVARAARVGKLQAVGHGVPFAPGLAASPFHTVVIVYVCCRLHRPRQAARPASSVERFHGVALCLCGGFATDDVEHQCLAVCGQVVNVECKLHWFRLSLMLLVA